MSNGGHNPPASPASPEGLPPLLETLRGLILQARQRVLTAANIAQVLTCWEIGRHIVEYEQGGAARASYGKRLLAALAEALTNEFGKGFDATNLRHMRDFDLSFPICDALRRELTWTHYRLLLRVDSPEARQWYSQDRTTVLSLIWSKVGRIVDADDTSEKPYGTYHTRKRPPMDAAEIKSRKVED